MSDVTQPKGKRLRAAGVAAGFAVVLGIAYASYWFIAARELRNGVAAWSAARTAAGDEVVWRDGGLSGFPATIRLTLNGLRFRTVPPVGEFLEASSETVVVSLNPARPQAVALRAERRFQVVFANGGGVSEAFAGRADFRLAANPSGGAEMAFDLGEIRLRSGDGREAGALERASGRIADLKPATPDHLTPTYAFEIEAADVTLPPAANLPLGRNLARIAVRGEVVGVLAAGPLTQSATRWRDSGGTVEVRRLEIDYKPASLSANGTLALDTSLQPMGALSAEIAGYAETIDRLREAGVMRNRDAATAKLVLGALARRDGAAGAPVITVPVTLQDRVLFLGPLRLLEVPRLDWPAAGRQAAMPAVASRQ